MNLEELKSSWDNLHSAGLDVHDQNEIQKIIKMGASITVTELNKKLFEGMAITALAVIISALGVVFFYATFEPVKHPQINITAIIHIQILGFVIFLVLFLSALLEFKLVNKKFSSDKVKQFLERTLAGFKRYYRLFNVAILALLFSAYSLELKYFMAPENLTGFIMVLSISSLLTGISYFVMKSYHHKNLEVYLSDLSSYLNELTD